MSNDPRELERLGRHINPGGWAIEQDKPIVTLLGSCVAACLWDPKLKVGGMNHFMLPEYEKSSSREFDVMLCGNYNMEALMNGMLGRGAQKNRMQAKLFGGGAVVASLTGVGVGERNAAFAREWLSRERIAIIASDLLGTWSRKVVFDPRSGDVFCRRGHTSGSIAEAEAAYARMLLAAPKKTDIELF